LARLLEVIACSVVDAVAAEAGGAHRLEIVRDLELGGLTPSIDLVRHIRAAVSIPLRVMLRENPGFEIGSDAELGKLRGAAIDFAEIGSDGFVLGFLRGGHLDLTTSEAILDAAPRLRATFHRAFEKVADRALAIQAIKASDRFDRILTSGSGATLQEYARQAAPEIMIVAGGGLDAEVIRNLVETTEIREFHVGHAARGGGSIEEPVDAERVRQLVALLG
jgi:copper homeostasis protein